MDGKVTCSVLLREREGAPEDFEHQDSACPRGSGEACRWKSFLEAVKLSGHIENGPAGEDAGERVSRGRGGGGEPGDQVASDI